MIEIAPVLSKSELTSFWKEKNEYFLQDIVPDSDLGSPLTEDETHDILSEQYHDRIEWLCSRETDRAHRVFFTQDGIRIGFCLYCIYQSEDGKCFVLDFCIFPPFRNNGYGKLCFAALMAYANNQGATYYELNTHCRRSVKFWEALGFVYNGYDDHGSILLILPPPDAAMRCEELSEADEWTLPTLVNSLRVQEHEPFLTDEQQDQLLQSVHNGQLKILVIKRASRVIGMCALSKRFSVRLCRECYALDALFIQPAFRQKEYSFVLADYVKQRFDEMEFKAYTLSAADEAPDAIPSAVQELNK